MGLSKFFRRCARDRTLRTVQTFENFTIIDRGLPPVLDLPSRKTEDIEFGFHSPIVMSICFNWSLSFSVDLAKFESEDSGTPCILISSCLLWFSEALENEEFCTVAEEVCVRPSAFSLIVFPL